MFKGCLVVEMLKEVSDTHEQKDKGRMATR